MAARFDYVQLKQNRNDMEEADRTQRALDRMKKMSASDKRSRKNSQRESERSKERKQRLHRKKKQSSKWKSKKTLAKKEMASIADSNIRSTTPKRRRTGIMDLPNEILNQIFVQDLLQSNHHPDHCHFTEYDTERESYFAYLESRRVNDRLYCAAREAFWQVYTAQCSFDHAAPAVIWNRWGGGLLFSPAMLAHCRYLDISITFGKREPSGLLMLLVVDKLKEILEEGGSVANLEVTVRGDGRDRDVDFERLVGLMSDLEKSLGRKLNKTFWDAT